MSKYKVGDKVRIHSLEYLKSIALNDSDSAVLAIPGHLNFIKSMHCMCSKIVTISEVLENAYRIQEFHCSWTEAMITGPSNKFTLGDIYA